MLQRNLSLLATLFVFVLISAACSKSNKDSLPDPDDTEDSTSGQDPAGAFVYETFEGNATKDYNIDTLSFKTGEWILDGAITAGTSADLFTGEQGLRSKGTVSMNFDMEGVQAVCISYGIYPAKGELANPDPTVFNLEVSSDQGKTYSVLTTDTVDVLATKLTTDTVVVHSSEGASLRFRIVNSSKPLDNGNLPRICYDDFGFRM